MKHILSQADPIHRKLSAMMALPCILHHSKLSVTIYNIYIYNSYDYYITMNIYTCIHSYDPCLGHVYYTQIHTQHVRIMTPS